MDRYITRTPNNNRQRLIKVPANHTFMVIQLNCGPGGLNSIKKLELDNFLYDIQPDIVLLQETWVLLQETWFKDKKTPQFHEYSMINRNRLPTYTTTGGGSNTHQGVSWDHICSNKRSYCSKRSVYRHCTS